jgi:AcrR family transcriptional regulator
MVLDAALERFAVAGWHGATTRAIAAAAGVTQGVIHQHFGSKRELYEAVFQEGHEAAVRGMRRAVDTDSIADAAIRILRFAARGTASRPYIAHFLGSVEIEAARHPQLAHLSAEHLAPYITEFGALAERARSRGPLPGGVRPEDVVPALWAMLIGATLYAGWADSSGEYAALIEDMVASIAAGGGPGAGPVAPAGSVADRPPSRPLVLPAAEDQPSSTAARLVRAATEVFPLTGFESTSVAEVAAAAGMTTGAVYRGFSSKDDLFVTACGVAETEFETCVRAALEQSDPGADRVATYLRCVAASAVQRPALATFRATAGVELMRSAALRDLRDDVLERRRWYLTDLLQTTGPAGCAEASEAPAASAASAASAAEADRRARVAMVLAEGLGSLPIQGGRLRDLDAEPAAVMLADLFRPVPT